MSAAESDSFQDELEDSGAELQGEEQEKEESQDGRDEASMMRTNRSTISTGLNL